MLNSSMIDVLIGVVFTFLAVSLAASAITEAISSFLNLRQTTLLNGVKALLNDPEFTGLARQLYQHALVNPLAVSTTTTLAKVSARPVEAEKPTEMPSYIEARNFALALHSILQAEDPAKPLADVVKEIDNDQLRQTLQTLLAASDGTVAGFQAEIGGWFDGAMERLGGWYKRYTQVIGLIAALAVAAILNADALHVTQVIWARPAATSELTNLSKTELKASDAITALDNSHLIGWADWDKDPRNGVIGWVWMVFGWLIAAAASLFGAPFWFDVLKRVALIQGTGQPVRKDKGGDGST